MRIWGRLLKIIKIRAGQQTKQGENKFQHVASPVIKRDLSVSTGIL